MKRVILIAFLAISCNKKTNTPPSTPNGGQGNKSNTVTLVTDGITHTVNENNSITKDGSVPSAYIDCFVKKYTNSSEFWLYIEGASIPFTMLIQTLNGPVTGTGEYKLNNSGRIEEKFTGGMTYKVDSGVINITTANSIVKGTYTMFVSNTNRNKTVTGTIDINTPSE